MKKFIGTKTIEAEPMTMVEAYEKNLLKVGRTPNQEQNEGYHVIYEGGYESWSPKDVFEKAYKCADTFVDRLQIELGDLTEKAEKLNAFLDTDIFKGLSKQKQTLLFAQYGLMQSYCHILKERIRIEEEG